MSYTAQNVITLAQRFMVDIDDDAYNDSGQPMLAYLNEGQKRFAAETHCCQSIQDISVTDYDTITYAALTTAVGATAEGVLFIAKVLPKTGDNWKPLPKALMSEMKAFLATDVTTPTRYSLFAEKVLFDTEPGTTLSFTAKVFFSFIPADIIATANILIPDEWVQALVKYIVFCCRVTDRDGGMARDAYAEFEVIKQAAAQVYKFQLEGIPG